MLNRAISGRASRPAVPRGRPSGYTLIEVGLVILLLGVVAIMVADFYVNQLSLNKDMRRVSGTVRDMQTLVDASVLWAEAYGRWPNDADVMCVEPLLDAGFLTPATRPHNRYPECRGCADYTILGWDRDVVVGPIGKGDYTSIASEAEDLVVRVQVWGRADAELIAGQLPQGHVVPADGNQPGQARAARACRPFTPLARRAETLPLTDAGAFVVEARVFEGGIRTGNFVRVVNENRSVVFGTESQAHNVQGGDLQRIGRITASQQKPPCRPGQRPALDACHSATSFRVTEGAAIAFHERPCLEGEVPERDGCRIECPPDWPRAAGGACPGPVSHEPTIMLREGVIERMCATEPGVTDAGCASYEIGQRVSGAPDGRVAGPALVMHGTAEELRTRPYGPVIHMLPDTHSGYAKVRVVGGLEIERTRGRGGMRRPGQTPPSGSFLYSLPSSQDVVTQSELDWVQCCLARLTYSDPTCTPTPDAGCDVSCSSDQVGACVAERTAARRLAAGS